MFKSNKGIIIIIAKEDKSLIRVLAKLAQVEYSVILND